MNEFIGVGRRKTAVASVRLRKGSGKVDINGRTLQEYFPIDFQQMEVFAPFEKVGISPKEYDLIIRVNGGGVDGQAIAVRLGISRALVVQDEDRKHALKEEGFLTRDPRKKERKKYGLAGARKRFQFSKR